MYVDIPINYRVDAAIALVYFLKVHLEQTRTISARRPREDLTRVDMSLRQRKGSGVAVRRSITIG
jgi:hypothetical protein